MSTTMRHNRGVSRTFIMGFPFVRNYRNIFGISSDQLVTIYILLPYMQKLWICIYICVPQVGVQGTLSVFILRGVGACPQQKIFEN